MQVGAERFLKHVCGWMILLMIPHIFFSVPFSIKLMGYEFIALTGTFVVFYSHALLIMPQLFYRKKYLLYCISLVLLALLYVCLFKCMKPIHTDFLNLLRELTLDSPRPRPKVIRNDFIPPHLYMSFMVTLAASLVYGSSIRHEKREKLLRELERQQITSNMQLLKSQLSPHFLFNAMNSLYSLSLKKSDKLPETILTMSDLLRYVTYDSNENMVNVKKEINYLQDYIKLQQLRLSPESVINLKVDNQNEQAEIAPMILVPFLENAFKHGVDTEGIVNIDCHITITNKLIEFHIENKKYTGNQKDKVHGIGIQNVKNRLYLVYGSKCSLDIDDAGEMYVVNLKIKL